MEAGDDNVGELRLRSHRVQNARANLFAESLNHRLRKVREQFVVGPHEFVRDGHQLAKHHAGGLGDADVIAQALRHFLLPIEAHENRHGHGDLQFLAVLALDFAAHEQIEFLLRGAQLHVGLENH